MPFSCYPLVFSLEGAEIALRFLEACLVEQPLTVRRAHLGSGIALVSESVKCHFSNCRFSAELNWENIRDGGQRRKTNPKSLEPALSLCRRAGIDAALAKADFFFAGAPTIENKIEQKIQNTKVASTKVAFDTV